MGQPREASEASAKQTLPLAQAVLFSSEVAAPALCGLDEVGRGALAGPLVAAAVVLPADITERLGPLARYLRDSKTVPAARRTQIAAALAEHAIALEIAEVDVEQINVRGIGWANREAFRRLICAVAADEYIVDGKVKPPAPPERASRVRCLVKADAQVPAVAAASLVAKVHRDALLARLAEQHPQFGWERNAGYGSPTHLAALRELGPTPHHRTAFVHTVFSGGQKAKRARRGGAETEALWG